MSIQALSRVLPVLFVIGLSGCAAAVIGGAAVGGYQISQSSRSADSVARDSKITAAINSLYVKDDRISALDIHVATYRGIVTLQGKVSSQSTARHAIELARGVQGVTQVVSKLVVAAN